MGPHPVWGYIYIIIPNHPHSTLYIQYPGITTQPRYALHNPANETQHVSSLKLGRPLDFQTYSSKLNHIYSPVY